MLLASFVILMAAAVANTEHHEERGIVLLRGEPGVSGTVTLTEGPAGLQLVGNVTGLTPGKHGFHVHQTGDLSGGCLSTGGHYNPLNHTHGAPQDEIRHAGDLGNIEADKDGVALIQITDKQISLRGERSIAGRAIVVHAGVDDLGLGGHADSKSTGNAGGRVACGIIGIL